MSSAIKLRTSKDFSPLVFLPVGISFVAVIPALMVSFGLITPFPGVNQALFVAISLIALIGFSVLALGYIRKQARRHAADLLAAELQISSILTEKYGIKLLERSVSIIDVESGAMSVTKHGIRAKNANGEDVLASIRVTDNNTDLVAYSNGKEFERVDQPVVA